MTDRLIERSGVAQKKNRKEHFTKKYPLQNFLPLPPFPIGKIRIKSGRYDGERQVTKPSFPLQSCRSRTEFLQLSFPLQSYRNSVRERQLWSGNDSFVTWRSPSIPIYTSFKDGIQAVKPQILSFNQLCSFPDSFSQFTLRIRLDPSTTMVKTIPLHSL